jgi:polyribonucleotide nucleotidyltransferase
MRVKPLSRPRTGSTMLPALFAALAIVFGALASTAVAQSPPPSDDGAEVTITERLGGGGGANVVTVVNRADNRMRIRGNVDLNRITGDRVAPGNHATAYASCTDCQTFSVALQINLVERNASYVAPQNTAVALNFACERCVTVAHAIQYLVPVDDPRETPREVDALVREMDRELREIAQEGRAGRIDVAEAQRRVNAVLDQFRALGMSLYEERDEAVEPTTPVQ